MPPTKMPTEGWVLIILTALGAKPLWDYLTKRRTLGAAHDRDRAEHSQEIELRQLTASEAEDRKLIRVLEAQIKDLRQDVGRLSKLVDGLSDERTSDKVLIATQASQIRTLEVELARVQGESEQYRAIAVAGQLVAERAGHSSAARQIGEEISEVSEASKASEAGGKR